MTKEQNGNNIVQLNTVNEQLDQLKGENDELKTEFDNFEEQIKLQSNFIDSFLNATNNSKWLNKSILEDEADAIIEKVESDYVQLEKYKQALQEIKNVAENILIECNNCDQYSCSGCPDENKEELAQQILQKCEALDD